jgi:flagellar protein FlbD
MITLHRLGHHAEELHLNPDLITTVEAHPDTVITLATGNKIVVSEAPDEVADAVREWRAGILDEAWRRRHAAV